MRIFNVLPRPVSPLVNPPPGVYPQSHRSPQNARNAAGVHQPTPARKTPQSANRTPHSVHQPKPYRHSTNRSTETEPGRLFKIILYSNPDEVAAHRVAPTETHRQPHREPERRRGVMGSPTDRSRPQRRTGGTEGNRKRPEPKPGALRLIYSFLTGQRRPRTEKLKYKVKSNLFTPLLNRKTAVCCRGAVLGE